MMSLEGMSGKALGARLLKHSLVYAGGTALQQAASVLLLPLYLSYLTPSAMGILALCEILVVLFSVVVNFGIPTTIARLYWDWKKDGKEKVVAGSLWVIILLVSASATLLLLFLGPTALNYFIQSVPFDPYLKLAIFAGFFSSTTQLPLALLRAREDAPLFIRLSNAISLSTLLSTVIFVAVLKMGAIGALAGTISGGFIGSIIAIFLMRHRMELQLRSEDIIPSIRFSIPMMPSIIYDSTVGILDRFILEKFLSLDSIGYYSLAMKLANAGIRVPLSAIKSAWVPFAIRLNKERDDGRERTSEIWLFLLTAMAIMAVGTIYFSESLLLLLGRRDFTPALEFLPWLVLSNWILVFDCIAFITIVMSGKTWIGILSSIAHALCLILLCSFLIPQVGALGAALAGLISVTVMVGVRIIFGIRSYSLPIPYAKAIAVLLLVSTAATISFLDFKDVLPIGETLVIKATLFVAFLVAIVLASIDFRKLIRVLGDLRRHD